MKMSDIKFNTRFTEGSTITDPTLTFVGGDSIEAVQHACERHDELVEALEITLESAKNGYACGEDFAEYIEAILNKAKGLDK